VGIVGQALAEPRCDALGLRPATRRECTAEVTAGRSVFGFGVAPEEKVHRGHELRS